jgi:hypothetical protein
MKTRLELKLHSPFGFTGWQTRIEFDVEGHELEIIEQLVARLLGWTE